MIRKLAPLFLILTLLLSPVFLADSTTNAVGFTAAVPEGIPLHDVVLPGAAAYLAPPTLRPSITPSIVPTSTSAPATSTPTIPSTAVPATPTATTGPGTNTPVPATNTPVSATNTPVLATNTPVGTATPTATFIPGTTPTPIPPTPTPLPTEVVSTPLPPGVVDPTPPAGIVPPDATVTAIVIPPAETPTDTQSELLPPTVTPTFTGGQAIGGVGGANIEQTPSSELVQGQRELPRIATDLEEGSDTGGGFQPGPQLFLILGAAALALAAGLVIYLRRQL